MSISVTCPGCGRYLQVGDDYPRRKLACPQCDTLCVLPVPGAPHNAAALKNALSEMPRPASRKSPGPAVIPKPPANKPSPPKPPAAEEKDDASTYEMMGMVGADEPRCPQCSKITSPQATICVECGYHLQLGQKYVKVYESVVCAWEAGLPYSLRMHTFLALQVAIPIMGVVNFSQGGSWGGLLASWMVFTSLTAFLLGTYDRINLTRNFLGRVVLTKTWRVFFISRPTITIPWARFEGVRTGMEHKAGFMEWFIFVDLFLMGIIPGIIWWVMAIKRNTHFVALTKDHGFPALILYKGWDQARALEVAATIAKVTELPYPRT